MRAFLGILAAIFLSACSSGRAEPRTPISVLTSLPLFWGEGGTQAIITSADQRAPVIRHLSETHILKPLDHLDASSLAQSPLLLVAQPRGLLPPELVALDDWIRSGGRALIFADPLLVWPSSYALGDKRRPPPITLLDPLLAHWGIELESPEGNAPTEGVLRIGKNTGLGAGMGVLTTKSASCQSSSDRRWIGCDLGKGKLVLVGDADILNFDSYPGNAAAIDSLIERLET